MHDDAPAALYANFYLSTIHKSLMVSIVKSFQKLRQHSANIHSENRFVKRGIKTYKRYARTSPALAIAADTPQRIIAMMLIFAIR